MTCEIKNRIKCFCLQVYGATYLQKLLEPLLTTIITSSEWQHISFEVDPTRFEFGDGERDEVCNSLSLPAPACKASLLFKGLIDFLFSNPGVGGLMTDTPFFPYWILASIGSLADAVCGIFFPCLSKGAGHDFPHTGMAAWLTFRLSCSLQKKRLDSNMCWFHSHMASSWCAMPGALIRSP